MDAEPNYVKAKEPELKTAFNASAASVLCFEGELEPLKAAQAEKV